MSLEATIAYKNDDNEIIGVEVRGHIYGLPELLREQFGNSYSKIVDLIDSSAKHGGVRTTFDGQFEPGNISSKTTPLDIIGIINTPSDVDYFVKDNGEVVSYRPSSVVRVDTTGL